MLLKGKWVESLVPGLWGKVGVAQEKEFMVTGECPAGGVSCVSPSLYSCFGVSSFLCHVHPLRCTALAQPKSNGLTEYIPKSTKL